MRKNQFKVIGTWSVFLFLILISYTETAAFTLEDSVEDLIKKHENCQFTKPDSAVYYLNHAIDIAENNTNLTLRLNNILAWYYANRQINLDSALFCINRATDLIPMADDSLQMGIAMAHRGHIHGRRNDFRKAFEWQEKAIAFKLIYNDSVTITQSFNLMANNYRNLAKSSKKLGHDYKNEELYEMALSYYRKGLSYCLNSRCAALLGKNMGITYLQLKDFPKAQNYFEKSIETYLNLKLKKAEILTRVKLGMLYTETGHYHKALEQYYIAEKYYQNKEKKKNIIPLLRNMATAYLRLGKLELAEENAIRSLNASKRRSIEYSQLETLALLVEIFAEKKDFESAYNYQQQYQSVKDKFSYHKIKEELLNQNLINEINANKIKLQLVERDKTIIAQSAQNLKLGIILLIVSSLLLLLLGVNFYQKRVEKLDLEIKKETHKRTLVSKALADEQKHSKQLQTEVEHHIRQLSELGETKGAKINKEAIENLYQLRLLTDEDWTEFKRLFLKVNPNFFDKFIKENPNISLGDLKVAALARLNFNNTETGTMMAISAESVRKARYRLRQKLQLEDNNALQSYIFSL